MKEYFEFWKLGFQFNGVSTRSEYWIPFLINLAIISLLYLSFKMSSNETVAVIFGFITLAFVLFSLIPDLAITVRRLHDANKSGAWFFISFIPYIGEFILFVILCFPTVKIDNIYGYYNMDETQQ
ncbi:DUF805 domain-containing protein [Paludicola sp. MB14-C6]|uniref:DUF805 domain-containing protein n=1 Tax=Paludihabitans sp. MB14-C6 TaxID=3070656 RepID=UPI0027DBC4C8|nr:DUF805 domain-containing protein [Paludicola sp. MB14-C6]WMJ23647.1 DUF805 domain-containing protein [Paludicola sp. MB14-C6]